MLEEIKINCHSSIKIKKDKTIYIDPYRIKEEQHDADYIFVTHPHYDHLSTEDILKASRPETIYIVTEDSKQQLNEIGVSDNNIAIVKPNNNYEIERIKFETVPAYNINKEFHPKENNWVGYIINLDGTKYYIAGDTDDIEEIEKINCDAAFLPIGGTYTMNVDEAADYINYIHPDVAIPIHYGSIAGDISMGEEFKNKVNDDIKVEVLIGEENGD